MKYAGEFRFLNNKSVCRNHEASHTGGGGLPRGDPKDKVGYKMTIFGIGLRRSTMLILHIKVDHPHANYPQFLAWDHHRGGIGHPSSLCRRPRGLALNLLTS